MSTFAAHLRSEITEQAFRYCQQHRLAFRRSAGSLVFEPASDTRDHGNFHPQSYRAILNRPMWAKRLGKALTVTERLRSIEDERRLCELDSCCSSDALLMNVFCHARTRRSAQVLAMLDVETDSVPIFGWRARVPLIDNKFDRTEVDMKFGNLLVEAKLTESSFESCPVDRMKAYLRFSEVFDTKKLPRSRKEFGAYQLLRNVLAANAHNCSFCLLTDARRPDLIETWYQVLSAVRVFDLRMRCKVLTWQELAQCAPPSMRRFLAEKYGIGVAVAAPADTMGY